MQQILILAISTHVLAAVFWAGSTFTVARTGTGSIDRLFVPQVAAAIVAIASGGYLWQTLHGHVLGPAEMVLGAGAISGILAGLLQVAFTGPALLRARRRGGATTGTTALEPKVLLAQRLAAVLLALAVICMAAARFV